MTKKYFILPCLFLYFCAGAMEQVQKATLYAPLNVIDNPAEAFQNLKAAYQATLKEITSLEQKASKHYHALAGLYRDSRIDSYDNLRTFIKTQIDELDHLRLQLNTEASTIKANFNAVIAPYTIDKFTVTEFDSTSQGQKQHILDQLTQAIQELKPLIQKATVLNSQAEQDLATLTSSINKLGTIEDAEGQQLISMFLHEKERQKNVALATMQANAGPTLTRKQTTPKISPSTAQPSSTTVDLQAYAGIDATWAKLRELQKNIKNLVTQLASHPYANHEYLLILRQLLNNLSTNIINFEGSFHPQYKRLPLAGIRISEDQAAVLPSQIDNLSQEINTAYKNAENDFKMIITRLKKFEQAMQNPDTQKHTEDLIKVRHDIGRFHLSDLLTGNGLPLLLAQQNLLKVEVVPSISSQPLPQATSVPLQQPTISQQPGTVPVPSAHSDAWQIEVREFEQLKRDVIHTYEELEGIKNNLEVNELQLNIESIKNNNLSSSVRTDYKNLLVSILKTLQSNIKEYEDAIAVQEDEIMRKKVNLKGDLPLMRNMSVKKFGELSGQHRNLIKKGLDNQLNFLNQGLVQPLYKSLEKLDLFDKILGSATSDSDAAQKIQQQHLFPLSVPSLKGREGKMDIALPKNLQQQTPSIVASTPQAGTPAQAPKPAVQKQLPSLQHMRAVQQQQAVTVPFTPPVNNELAGLLQQFQDRLHALDQKLQ